MGIAAQQYDLRVFGVEDGLPGSTVHAITQDSAGFLWVDTDGGLCRFDGRTFRSEGTAGWPGHGTDQLELNASNGARWSIVRSGGIDRYHHGRIQHFSQDNGLSSDELTCLFEDRSGVIWIGSRAGGLIRYTSDAVIQYGRSNGLPSSQVVSISWKEGNTIITTRAGFVVIDSTGSVRAKSVVPGPLIPGTQHSWPTPDHAPRLNCLVRSPDGRSWAASDHGVEVDSPDGILRVGRDTTEAIALAVADDSMLIGTHHGLFTAPLDNSAANWTHLFRAGEEDITSLVRDRAGNVWIGTADRGVLRYSDNGTQRWTTREKLVSDRVRSLLLDAYQNLWVGTDRGFDLLELDDLQEEVINIKHYGLADGFPGIDAMPNACMLDADSALWFGTTRGAVRFDPRRVLEDPIAPRTRITDLALFFEHADLRPWCDSVTVDGLPVDLQLPHDQNHLTFTFTGLSLAYPEKVRFQFMLEGHDADWSPITPNDRITYTDLAPGSYVFLVKARNGSGVWNDEPARFAFMITPPFWMTGWFRITGGIAFVLAFFGLQRLRDRRTRQVRERLERMVTERTQELSDEKHRSEILLLNILPETTAAELKKFGSAQARSYAECTVLFSDFQGFTVLSEQLEATGIVTELDRFFRAFDRITDTYGTEKIKTIGDAYMCASGVPEPSRTHALDAVLMAFEMLSVVEAINADREQHAHPAWPIRIGLNSGPLIAGVVGEKKFAYDVWGDTVNLASRMESSGVPGRINVTSATLVHVEPYVQYEARGKVMLKGKGGVESWFIDRLRPEYSTDDRGRTGNDRLMELRAAWKRT